MVATRNHPKDFEPPTTESPTKRSTRSSAEPTATESPRKRTTRASASASTTSATPSKAAAGPASPNRTRTSASSRRSPAPEADWSHTPSTLTLIWLAISLPLVLWDTGYIVLRPHSMPGGSVHSPLWKPYGLYGEIDHTYGFKAYYAHNGFVLAQGSFNGLETAAYLVYLYLVFQYGRQEERPGRGAPGTGGLAGRFRELGESRTLYGPVATWAVLVGYSTASLTFWKTVLYWLNEAFSGFDNIGHNDWPTLILLWIIPNGLWLVFPAYLIYVFGAEILQGLAIAGQPRTASR